MLFNSVNPHCLDSIVRLSEERTVLASDDIFDERGMKLWAKGQPVSRSLHEKLLRRRLAKPLETSLEVENAISFNDILASARAFIDQNPLIGRIAGREALSMLASLRSFPIPPALRLLLTSAQVDGSRTYTHTMTSVLVSAGLGSRAGMSERDGQLLMVAALLHDVGEMYVNPDYLKSAYRLEPHEWKHVAGHPRIGQLLIEELTTLPRAVAEIVGQHHERLDGSGYPDQLAGPKQNKLSSWLAVADTTAAMLSRSDCGAALRVGLALRIVPEEYDRRAISTMIQALKNSSDKYGQSAECAQVLRAEAVWQQVTAAVAAAEAVAARAPDNATRELARATVTVLANLDKALRATGAISGEFLREAAGDSELAAEVCLIVREAEWRMRNLARNLHLRAEAQTDAARLDALKPLIDVLNGPQAAG